MMKSELSEAERTPSGDKELEHVTCESDAKLDKSHEHLPEMQESTDAEDADERVMTSHTEMCEGCVVTSGEEGHDVERVILVRQQRSAIQMSRSRLCMMFVPTSTTASRMPVRAACTDDRASAGHRETVQIQRKFLAE